MASMSPDKVKSLFGDLGKATMRGVRKCPKCGTYNGTRGISCKNKACDVVFKEKEKKKCHSAESVKIITGTSVEVYSIRLRNCGPDYRAFVQFSSLHHSDEHSEETVDNSVLAQTARCYVESCPKNALNDVEQEPCNHVKLALNCDIEAQPLMLKNSVLNSLQVDNEIKQAIWLLATETTGPLVQRVTRNIMVVKCKPTTKQPLGFLHFAFFETSRNKAVPKFRFQCSCKAFKAHKQGKFQTAEQEQKRCLHFYACVCAFASDDKLSDEFSYYIGLINIKAEGLISVEKQLVTLFDDSNTNETVDTASLESPTLEVALAVEEGLPCDQAENKFEQRVIGDRIEIVYDNAAVVEDFFSTPEKKSRIEDAQDHGDSALLTIEDSDSVLIYQSKDMDIGNSIFQNKDHKGNSTFGECTSHIFFKSWLSSVTERINQTMHYQFDGFPEPLVFHAPQIFFDCLQQRISFGSKRKRIPCFSTGFVRKEALPFGKFTKYTWHITNVLHVKQIFDTSEIPLDITRNFIENRDGTFDVYALPSSEEISKNINKNQPAIRPFELKTFLKVGKTTSDQKDPIPFIIEWIPDILPITHIGELRLKFEFGHQRNGHIEIRQL